MSTLSKLLLAALAALGVFSVFEHFMLEPENKTPEKKANKEPKSETKEKESE